MWQAKLINVIDNLEKTVDALKLEVDLFHADGRKITKTYIIYLDELTEVSLTSLKAQIQVDLDRLTKLDQVKTALVSKIGKVM
jgi:hypothetical protein